MTGTLGCRLSGGHVHCSANHVARTTAAVPPTAGQLVSSELGVCEGPLAFLYADLMSHTAFHIRWPVLEYFINHVANLCPLRVQLSDDMSVGVGEGSLKRYIPCQTSFQTAMPNRGWLQHF
jgi:hypothetical protein